jgi:hypothetical protein
VNFMIAISGREAVYHSLRGYHNVSRPETIRLRNDPLFQTLVDHSPRDGQPLASGSTIKRFCHALQPGRCFGPGCAPGRQKTGFLERIRYRCEDPSGPTDPLPPPLVRTEPDCLFRGLEPVRKGG